MNSLFEQEHSGLQSLCERLAQLREVGEGIEMRRTAIGSIAIVLLASLQCEPTDKMEARAKAIRAKHAQEITQR